MGPRASATADGAGGVAGAGTSAGVRVGVLAWAKKARISSREGDWAGDVAGTMRAMAQGAIAREIGQ